MTKAELIKALEPYPDDAPVAVSFDLVDKDGGRRLLPPFGLSVTRGLQKVETMNLNDLEIVVLS